MTQADHIPPLCAEIRSQLQRHLAPNLTRALDDFDSKLFSMAASARLGSDEQRFLDALRELRRQRSVVERSFLGRVGQAAVGSPAVENRRAPASPLSLFARDELEERLALSSVATSVAAHLNGVLRPLNYRLASLVGGAPYTDENNPIGPLSIGEAFRDAMQGLDIASDLRMLAYRMMPMNLYVGIADCYERCNTLLINAGVLLVLPDECVRDASADAVPDERPTLVQAVPQVRHQDAQPLPAARKAAAVSGGSPESPAQRSDPLAKLANALLTRRAASSSPPRLDGMAESREVSRERLNDAMATLLRDDQFNAGELKRRLLDLAQRQSPARVALSAHDEGTVDLVATLFKRMSSDDSLPSALGRIVAALQVPFLNAALQDQAMINNPAHPARVLMDEFGDTARGWSVSADPGQRLQRQMQVVQSQLQAQADDSAASFQAALREFREFSASVRMQAEQAEQRAIESTRSREALQQAQIDARLTIDMHMAGFAPSAWLRQLLTQHWAAYLVLVMLRYGMVSDHYREAIGFADALLVGERDSVNPIHAASFRARRLELETQLRQGLATLAYADSDIVRLCGELHTFILLGAGHMRKALLTPVEETDRRMDDQPRPETHDASVMRHLRGLRPGTWFELGKHDDEAERGRLSWISPMSGRWMLVNWAGRKLMDLPPERMAADIARGLARVIPDANLLRRAVDEVMAELQQDVSEDGGPNAHAER